MSLLLNIDTSQESASICLADGNTITDLAVNDQQQDHASWIHSAINNMLSKANHTITNLQAIAVSIGPGSYTGLRVGLATAKGLCYALNIPLITIGTLEIMANAVKDQAEDLICPMIDARRMEVFTALYNKSLEEIEAPQALILEQTAFAHWLSSHKILFCGSGSKKLQPEFHPNSFFIDADINASHIIELSSKKFAEKKFAEIAYTEPLYIKEFYSIERKN
jgi:tRNA threonylcarbamoyladenosine biosynthesis protein TsaB